MLKAMIFTAFTAIFLTVLPVAGEGGQTIYVFYPSTTRPAVVQQQIGDACGGDVKVTAFARFQDFDDKTRSDLPDIVITKPRVLQHLPGYSIRLTGLRNGISEEPCVLLSIGKGVDLDSISGITIGAVDLLGRVGTEKRIAESFKQPVRVNRVIKIEDLLPMLLFNKAQAIFIGEGNIEYLQKATNLKLAVTEIPGCSSGIVVCAVRTGDTNRETAALLRDVFRKTKTVLEIDQWKQEK
jgi:hypothetical protein